MTDEGICEVRYQGSAKRMMIPKSCLADYVSRGWEATGKQPSAEPSSPAPAADDTEAEE